MPSEYIQNYTVILLMLGVVVLLAGAMILLSWLLGPHRPTARKLSPYECGMTPTGDARQRISVKFYLVAMVFILFDVEIVFLYPWAIIFHELRLYGFIEMVLFLALVLSGFAYLWKKGALDWAKGDTGELQ
jgi:NADH-quinone oxidoreductase subunit A